MGNLDDLTRLPDGFDGTVRLFPLPSLVLFPHAMQPLHVFEPRYCEMLAEALATDDLITMATLTGEPPEPKSPPPINRTVCVGRIFSHVPREADRHNILLVGIKRAEVISEVDAGRCFRIAKVKVLDDVYPPEGNAQRGQLRRALLRTFAKVIPATATGEQSLNELLAGSTGLGPIADIISFRLPLPAEQKLQLLGESNVDRRAERLMDFIKTSELSLQTTDPTEEDQTPGLQFPPPFSTN